MRLFNQLVARVSLLFVCFAGSAAFGARLEPTGQSVDGEVLVRLKAGVSANDVASLGASVGADQVERLSNLRSGALWRLHSRSKNSAALATALEKNPNVEYVEPNYIVRLVSTPNDPSYTNLWGLNNTGQTVQGQTGLAGSDIAAETAWGVTTGSAAVVVGVVDTGIDYNHPDLAANVWNNPGGKGNAACGAGTHGFNAIANTCDPMDDHNHGTHVSGTIGAVGNNGVGVAGVNWTASIMGLKFLDSGGYGNTADAIEAIEFAVQAKIGGVNVRVLSNSWGGFGFSRALLDEINKANENDILFVASAGNNASNTDLYPHYPSGYQTANMISVAALDNRDLLAYFSNYGPATVHLGAPGVSVYSTLRNNSYGYFSGTSMAAPHVAGVAALLLAKTPGLTTAQVKDAILNNTDSVGSLAGKSITGGRLNAAKAIGAPLGPDFTLAVAPPSRTVARSSSTTYVISVTPANGFSASVDFAVSGLPSGVTGSFNPVSSTTSTTLTLNTSANASFGTFPFVVTATGGGKTRSIAPAVTISSAPPVTSCPGFASRSAYYGYPAGGTGLAIGDLNRDGKPDLAIANVSNNRVQIFIGSANGSFTNENSYAVGTAPVAAAIGDFNGDGRADVAAANSNSQNVSVLLGNGDGTMQSAVSYGAGTNPFSVAAGDVNGDGKLDLAVANNGSSNVSILIGNGDGTFQTAVHYGSTSGPFHIAAGDLNGDGKLDLAVAGFHAGKVSVLIGAGDGTFASAVDYAAGNGPSAVAIGDLTGDGRADLAVSNFTSDSVSLLAGNGNGTFQGAVNTAVGDGPYSVAIGDFNNDAKPDLVTANNNSANVSIVLGAGGGSLRAATHLAGDTQPNFALAADFNGDGKTDIVAVNGDYYILSVWINNGTCSQNCSTMAAAVPYATTTDPLAVAAGDLNADGIADVIAANGNSVSVRLGAGDGTLGAAAPFNTGMVVESVTLGDFDRDGKLDVATANSGSGDLSVLLGNGDGTLGAAASYNAGTTPRFITTGDFNRDGRLDLAVANAGSSNISVLLGNANGTFQSAQNTTVGSTPRGIGVGDFNRDGRLDLAVANSGSNNLSILLGNDDGTFQTPANVTAGTSPVSVVASDINRDGKLDLLVANSGSNNVSVRLGNGDGTFGAISNHAAGTSPSAVAVADFNDDGKLDLAVANAGSANISIRAGTGAGGFGGAVNAGVGTGPAGLAIADLNRDAKPDLVSANGTATSVSVVLNTCPVPDLAVTKTHSGSFTQGDTGRTYTVTVSNAGITTTDGVVTVTEVVPPGLVVTAMSGTGWTCAVTTCTRADALAAGASYPAITVTANVTNNAPPTVTNQVTVSGGGDLNGVNNTASDPATVTPVTDLVVTSAHAGNFTQGDTNRKYTLHAKNAGGVATSGTVTVTDTLPSGLTATAISGSGWNCVLGTLTCTRNDVLAASSSYPPITLTVNVAANAPSSVTNTVSVSGGGETNTTNNTANDPTSIWSSSTCGSFNGPVAYTTGYAPTAIATRDFNGDGHADLAVANFDSDNVSILLGNGNGTFATAVNYAAGDSPNSIALGDYNSDGKTDLAVVNYYSSSISILLGNGNGTFASGTAVNATSPRVVVAGDFNGDGNTDLALGRSSSTGGIAIHLGTGSGTFANPSFYSIGDYGYALRVADFNGDGKQDLVAARGYGAAVLLGNGDGTFQAAATFSDTWDAYSVAVGDFDRDGDVDFAMTSTYSSAVRVRLGNGDGTFSAATSFTAPSYASNIVAEDVTGDGNLDLLVTTWYDNAFVVLIGQGNGTFGAPASMYAGFYADDFVIGDFDGDGRADAAVANYYLSQVSVLLDGCPDLSIAKTHTGNFTAGQTNAEYRIVVSNTGGASRGTVTVTDVLPTGLTATAISGSGWACTLESLTCTRTTSVSGSASFPTIFVTVSVSSAAPAEVTNTATVSGGGDTNPANNTANDVTTIVRVADLSIQKTHGGGTFVAGESGRTYTITVGNVGSGPTTGTVTVVDNLPSGLTATAMSGTGWNCVLDTRTCTRSDALEGNTLYPPISITVNVAANAPSTVTNSATVSGGGDTKTSNNTATDPANVLTTPAGLVASAISTTQISLIWNASANGTNYQVLRSTNGGPYTVIAAPLLTNYTDASLAPNTTYVYRVRAVDATSVGSMSNVELATTILFTDDPVVASSTRIKAIHLTELRGAVNAVRAAAGLAPSTFTDASLGPGMTMKAVHVTELQAALDQARAALGLPAIVWTDNTITRGLRIKAVHLREIRSGVK